MPGALPDAWTLAGAVGGVVVALAAVATLIYMARKDRADQAPIFRINLGPAGMQGRLRFTLSIIRDGPLPEWRLVGVQVLAPRGAVLLTEDDTVHDRPGAVSKTLDVIANSEKIRAVSLYVQTKLSDDRPQAIALRLVLRRETGARRTLNVRTRVSVKANARPF